MIDPEDLLKIGRQAVDLATSRGADQAEVFVEWGRESRVDIQKNDVHNGSTGEETTIGIRVLSNGSLGFATVNRVSDLALACDEALALARVAPPDEHNVMAAPGSVQPLDRQPDPTIQTLTVGDLVGIASKVLARIAQKDGRVVVDSGDVYAAVTGRALVTSTGIELAENHAFAGGSVFGMAVTPTEVGSFDHDGQSVLQGAQLLPELEAAADRFVIKTLGALGATQGESFRGTAILLPEVVAGFVVSNVLSVLDGRAVRTGKSPFAQRLGHEVASPMLTLVDDGRALQGVGTHGFDREGTPTRRTPLIEHGVLQHFLYDVYEAKVAGQTPRGHARGGAASPPSIGPSFLTLEPGDQSFTRLCCDPARAVVVSRFSGSCNPITGEFSGVVKGGFLMKEGHKVPVKETMIAGNLYELLRNVSGVSAELRNLGGSQVMPSLRVEDISITAG